MKILLLSDIHANWAALQAIDEPHDLCVCLGDLVDYGAQPQECLEWVRQHCAVVVRGNHDHCVAQMIEGRPGVGFKFLANATRRLMWDLISKDDRRYLNRLPLSCQGVWLDHSHYLVHAIPQDPLDTYLMPDHPAWENQAGQIDAEFLCVGHTHIQFELEFGGTRVINPGSVGQPRDGEATAAYAVVEDGRVEFRRVPYDIDAAIDALARSALPPEAVELSAEVLRTGGACLKPDSGTNNTQEPVTP